jgi:hypothetical protein
MRGGSPRVKTREDIQQRSYRDAMKHITYAEKSLLLGNDTADALLDYAAALATVGRGESVTVHAISSDGDEVDATFLLGAGAPLMAETTTNTLPEPDNDATVHAIRADLQRMQHPDPVEPSDPKGGVPQYGGIGDL